MRRIPAARWTTNLNPAPIRYTKDHDRPVAGRTDELGHDGPTGMAGDERSEIAPIERYAVPIPSCPGEQHTVQSRSPRLL